MCALADSTIGALANIPQMLKVILTSATKQHISFGFAGVGIFLVLLRSILCFGCWGICFCGLFAVLNSRRVFSRSGSLLYGFLSVLITV